MNTRSFSPCLGQSQIPRVGITYCLGQSEINPYFFSPCLIDYQIGTRVGAQKHTPPAHLSSTISPFAGRLVGRIAYAPTLPEKDEVSSGRCYLLSPTIRDEYVFHFSMSNQLSDRYPCRGVLNTPLAHLSSTPTPFAGRLVRRMQYAPTLPEKDEVSLGRCYLLSRTIRDEYVFNSIMSNRLSDRYPGRGVLNTPHIDSLSTPRPLQGVG